MSTIKPYFVWAVLLATVLLCSSALANSSVIIDLSSQQAYLYKNGKRIATSPVSTGKQGHRTPTGTYYVSEKDYDHRSSCYGNYVYSSGKIAKYNVDNRKDKKPSGSYFKGAPMWYFMRFNGAIGMHVGNLPGYPASHGCVRMPSYYAKLFYNNCKVGTRITVRH
ncbi:MAG: L,D-transpeptidase family protein [Verrucomicrobiota bacterium]